MSNEENESIYRKKKQAHEAQRMTADGADVCTCKNQTSWQRFWSEQTTHKKDVHLYLASIRIENSYSVMLAYTGISEDSGETDKQ